MLYCAAFFVASNEAEMTASDIVYYKHTISGGVYCSGLNLVHREHVVLQVIH